jgi:group II intron reverse transcriptase/maturase
MKHLWRWLDALRTGDAAITRYAPSRAPQIAEPLRLDAREIVEMPPPVSRQQRPERLFTRYALQRAWQAIRQAKGGPGVDGVTLSKFEARLEEELTTLQQELIAGSYRPRPLRQVLVPKAGEGMRGLAIWALRDRVAQRTVYDLLTPVFEPQFLPCSFGFRPGLGVEQAVQSVVTHRDANLRWVVDADIVNCFDAIDSRRLHGLVRRRVRDRLVLRYVEMWLRAELLSSLDGKPRRAGASQGSALSPLLANIYLHQLDVALTAQKLALVRYADDFVICCRRRADAQDALDRARRALAQLGLEVHEQKTQIVHFDQGFAWLGHFFIRQECHRLANG